MNNQELIQFQLYHWRCSKVGNYTPLIILHCCVVECSCRLHEIGRGDTLHFQGDIIYGDDVTPRSDENSRKNRLPHCSFCGHPGSKRVHIKFACEYCTSSTSMGCSQKPAGFKCNCSSCDLVHLQVSLSVFPIFFLMVQMVGFENLETRLE